MSRGTPSIKMGAIQAGTITAARHTWVRGIVNTRHHVFEAIGPTREAVEDLLLDAWVTYAVATPYADADLMADYVRDDEVSWSSVTIPGVTMDGEPV